MSGLGPEGRRFESYLPDHKSAVFRHSHPARTGTERENKARKGTGAHGIVPERVPWKIPAHPDGSWLGLKPSDGLLAVYDGDGFLMFVFDSDVDADLILPDGDRVGCFDATCLPRSLDNSLGYTKGHVYFIGGDVGGIKIGRSVNVAVRLKDIQALSPIPVRLLATREGGEYEQTYHQSFAAHRLHGEWFAPHPDILAEIDRLKEPRNG